MDTERLLKDRQIDPSQLDLAAATQADVFFYWAELASKARMEQDRAKAKIEMVESRLSLECRQDPDNFGLTKVTEAALGAAVKSHKLYLDAVDAYFNAREQSLLLEAAVAAMEQRKRMIEIMVTLHGQQYFAGPSVPRNLVTSWNDYQQTRGAELHKKQTDRVRKPGQRAKV